MRHLAACPACTRQYDVGPLAPGARFRCSCGTMTTVPALAEAHRHLHALHCGTCGAARGDATARVCAFCRAAFSDDDLRRDTVCPGCFARIAEDARFCDHCGVAIAPLTLVSSTTELACPACGPECQLRARHLGTPAMRVDECARCGGLWLGMTAFDAVLTRARSTAPPPAPPQSPPTSLPPSRGPLYRPCPQCAGMMNRANYGRASAVIIDTCTAHGLWFDADELTRVIAWIHAGGPDRQRAIEGEHASARRRQEDLARSPARPERDVGTRLGPSSPRGPGSIAVDLVIGALELLFTRR